MPSHMPRSLRITPMKWMQVLERRGMEEVSVRSWCVLVVIDKGGSRKGCLP